MPILMRGMKLFGQRYIDAMCAHPWLSLALLPGLGRLSVCSDFRVNFGPDNPQLQAFEQQQNRYGTSEHTLFTLAPSSAGREAVFSPAAARAVLGLTKAAWSLPPAIRVESLANFRRVQARGNALHADELLPRDLPITALRQAEIAALASKDARLLRRLLSADGAMTGVLVTTEFAPGDSLAVETHIAAACELRARVLAQHPELVIHLTGTNAVSVAFAEVALMLLLRSLRLGMICMLALALPITVCFGVWGLLSGVVSCTMAVAVGIVIGVVADDTVHIAVASLRARRQERLAPHAAVMRVFASVGPALVASSLVLAIGFSILARSAFLPNSGMAALTVIAVVAALLINRLIVVPLLLVTEPREDGARVQQTPLPDGAADAII